MCVRISKATQVEAELEKLSQAEQQQVPGRLDDMIEDSMKFTPEFEAGIQQSECVLAALESIQQAETVLGAPAYSRFTRMFL